MRVIQSMETESRAESIISAESYLAVFSHYRRLLDTFDEQGTPFGHRLELLFIRVLHLLAKPDEFNRRLPRTFTATAQDYLQGNTQTVRHFNYDENRQFFLMDLLRWLEINGQQNTRLFALSAHRLE